MSKEYNYHYLSTECEEILYLPCGPAQDYTLFKKGDRYGFFRNDDFQKGFNPGISRPIGDFFGYSDIRILLLDGMNDECAGFISDIPCKRCILALKNSKGWTVYSFDSDLMNAEYADTDLPGLRLLFKDMPKFVVSDIENTMLYAKASPDRIETLGDNQIFVFGSNLEGMHGGGAAKIAHEKFGAVWGQGVGFQGRSYAIPTMHGPVDDIKPYVDDFLSFAGEHPELEFLVTRIGCGIAGFTDAEVAPLFASAAGMPNVRLPKSFIDILTLS